MKIPRIPYHVLQAMIDDGYEHINSETCKHTMRDGSRLSLLLREVNAYIPPGKNDKKIGKVKEGFLVNARKNPDPTVKSMDIFIFRKFTNLSFMPASSNVLPASMGDGE